jgi:hypothetical protein
MAQTTYMPLTWKNMDLSDPRQMRVFQAQLADWGNQLQAAVTVLNGSVSGFATVPITGAEMNPKDNAFGGVSGAQSFDATGASEVIISLSMNASTALTINNLTRGVPLFIDVTSLGNNFTFVLHANDPVPTTYAVRSKLGSDTAAVNLSVAGVTLATNERRFFWGTSFSSQATLLVSEN